MPTHSKNQRGFPTETPIGAEVLQLWKHANGNNTRVCFYAESELRPRDWMLLRFASGESQR